MAAHLTLEPAGAPVRGPTGWRAWRPEFALLLVAVAVVYAGKGGLLGGALLTAATLLVLGAFLVLRLGGEQPRDPVARWFEWLGVATLLAGLVAAALGVRPALSLWRLVPWLAAVCAYLLSYRLARQHGPLPLAAVLTGAMLSVVAALFVFWVLPNSMNLAGTLDYKNTQGIAMLVATLLAWGWALAATRPQARALLVAAGCLCAVALWWSHSRAALYLWPVVGAACLAALPARRRRTGLVLAFLIALVGLAGARGLESLRLAYGGSAGIAATPVTDVSRRMLITPADFSWYTRLELWDGAWRMFRDRPWGWGPNAYRVVYPAYAPPVSRIYSVSPHNLYLQFLAEWGAPGALLLAGTFAAGALAFWRGRGAVPEPAVPLYAAAVAALGALAVHGAVDMAWDIPAIPITAGVLAGFAAGSLPAQAPAAQPGPVRHGAAVLLLLALLAGPLRQGVALLYVSDGHRYSDRGELTRALAAFAMASRVDPWLPEAWYGQAWILRRFFQVMPAEPADLATAIRHAERAAALDPWDSWLHYELGNMREGAGDLAGARQAYGEALRRFPHHGLARVQLAALDLWEGNPSAAAAGLETLFASQASVSAFFLPQARDEIYTMAHLLRAEMRWHTGDLPGAAADWSAAAALAPADAALQSLVREKRQAAGLDQ